MKLRLTGALFAVTILATSSSLETGVNARQSKLTNPTVSWNLVTLFPSTSILLNSLITTNSSGTRTFIATGDCAISEIKLATNASGKCKVTLKIAAKGIYASRTASRMFPIVAVVATTTNTALTTTTSTTITPTGSNVCAHFPNLGASAGAGAGYAKPLVTATCSATQLTVKSNGMIGYTFQQITPNSLAAQNFTWTIPLAPLKNSAPTSIVNKLGALGFTVTGLPIYGPTEGPVPPTEAFGDPVYNGILDSCKGHTGPSRDYHYHALLATSACLLNQTLLGFALDGFPIYSNPGNVYKSGYSITGNPKTNSWSAYTYKSGDSNTLDSCNGRVSASGSYGYYITTAFPYIIGCFAGTPTTQ